MIQLVPMNEERYNTFMEISRQDQIQGQILARYWKVDEAEKNMEQMEKQVIPHGLETENHHFYSLKEIDSEKIVGGLWYMIMEQSGEHIIFVVDIQVYQGFRRLGYGSQAFRILEQYASDRGISSIVLNVFEHNVAARAMYNKLGYSGSGIIMTKTLNSDTHSQYR